MGVWGKGKTSFHGEKKFSPSPGITDSYRGQRIRKGLEKDEGVQREKKRTFPQKVFSSPFAPPWFLRERK
jgi:hypothetical protein